MQKQCKLGFSYTTIDGWVIFGDQRPLNTDEASCRIIHVVLHPTCSLPDAVAAADCCSAVSRRDASWSARASAADSSAARL